MLSKWWRSWRGGAGVAAVLAGAVLLACVPGENPLPARDEAPAALPPDLARVPSDAFLILSVRLADLWASDLGKPVRESREKELKNAPQEFESHFGVPIDQVERFSLVVLDAPGGPEEPLLFVCTTKPYDRAQVVAAVGKDAKEEKHKGQTFHVGDKDRAVWLIGERAAVFSKAGEIRSLLDRAAPRGEGDLGPALRLAAGKHSVAVGMNVKAFNDTVGGMLPPQADPFRPLLQARSAAASLDLDGQARVEVTLNFPDEKSAKAGDKALKAALDMARAALADAAQNLGDQKEMAKVVEQIGHLQGGLKEAKVEQKGGALRVSAAVKLDGATTGTAALEAVQKVRSAASRTQSANNLKQMALALHNYHETYKAFPPHALYGKQGKPLLSWRVLILPFIEQANLYNQFKLDEPWDSEHNKKLLAKIPKVYRHPSDGKSPLDHTVYQVFVGKGTVFEGKQGIRIADITDGTSNTLLVVEAAKAVPWTKPEDIAYDPSKPLAPLARFYPNGFQVGFCDGSVRMLPRTIKPQTMRNLITRNDGNVIDLND